MSHDLEVCANCGADAVYVDDEPGCAPGAFCETCAPRSVKDWCARKALHAPVEPTPPAPEEDAVAAAPKKRASRKRKT